jgi:hypothetical protein
MSFVAPLLFAAALGDFSSDPQLAKYRNLPHDVRVFIDRRMGCGHWAGEGAEDPERVREIQAALRDLRCAALPHDEQALRRRYRASPKVLAALTETADLIW